MDERAARQVLKRHGWLSLMPPAFANALLDTCTWRRIDKGQPIYVAGDPPGGMFGVAEGVVAMTSGRGAASAPAGHYLTAGGWTGLGPLLSGEPRRATMLAVTPALIAHAPLPALKAMLDSRPAWWMHIAQELLLEFDVVTGIATDLMIRDSTRRCAATLLRLAGCRRTDPGRSEGMAEARIAQTALAEMLGVSRSTLNPILCALERRGWIEIDYRFIRLADINALRELADED